MKPPLSCSALNQSNQTSQWIPVSSSGSTSANIPVKVKNLIPTNTDRHHTEAVYKAIRHDDNLVLQEKIPKNFQVDAKDHLRIKPSIEHRDNPFLSGVSGQFNSLV